MPCSSGDFLFFRQIPDARFHLFQTHRCLIWSQSIDRLASAHFIRLFRWSSVSRGLDIGRLNFSPASFSRRQMVLWSISTLFFFKRFSISRLIAKISWSASERIYDPILSSLHAIGQNESNRSNRWIPSIDQANTSRSSCSTWPLSPQLPIRALDPTDGKRGDDLVTLMDR